MTLPELLEFAFLTGGFTTRSDTTRQNAELVIEAVEDGFLTTNTPRDGRGNVLRLTQDGHDYLANWAYNEHPEGRFGA